MSVYAFIDVSKKQQFIYKSNELKCNLYNSLIIKAVTEDTGVESLDFLKIFLSEHLEKFFREKYSFVYSGGGNSIIKFPSVDIVHNFIESYSSEILKYHPSLELYISFVDEDEEELRNITDNEEKERKIRKLLYKRSDELKDSRKSKFRRVTYGVEKINDEGEPEELGINNGRFECVKENKDYKKARDYLYNSLEVRLKNSNIKITSELTEYKKSNGDNSYIGVIAIDGNKMGQMVETMKSFENLKQFSKAISQIYEEAVIKALTEYSRKYDTEGTMFITPIVMAGDDICIIVKAKGAIEIAAGIIKEIQELSKKIKKGNRILNAAMKDDEYLTACGGAAIVRAGYPFFEAVTIAEKLCDNAKESIYESGEEKVGSFIDWKIIQGATVERISLDENLRHDNYIENFHIKPLKINISKSNSNSICDYDSFLDAVSKIKASIKDESISTSMIEGIRQVMYSGKESYSIYFDTKDRIEKLVDIIEKSFSIKLIHGLYQQEKNFTYIFNDIINVLKYI